MKHGTLITKHLGLGVSKKYLYPTTGNMNILTPPCLWKLQKALPPCPPNSKVVNPPSLSDFSLSLEFLL